MVPRDIRLCLFSFLYIFVFIFAHKKQILWAKEEKNRNEELSRMCGERKAKKKRNNKIVYCNTSHFMHRLYSTLWLFIAVEHLHIFHKDQSSSIYVCVVRTHSRRRRKRRYPIEWSRQRFRTIKIKKHVVHEVQIISWTGLTSHIHTEHVTCVVNETDIAHSFTSTRCP